VPVKDSILALGKWRAQALPIPEFVIYSPLPYNLFPRVGLAECVPRASPDHAKEAAEQTQDVIRMFRCAQLYTWGTKRIS
jgi:hypothetical protein